MTRVAPGGDAVLAAIEVNYPGWRAWRTGHGLRARKAGVAPAGPHARGDTAAELMRSIEHADRAMTLTAAEQAALGTLKAAGGPMRVRAVSDATGLAVSTASMALAGLHARWLGGATTGGGGRTRPPVARIRRDRRPGGRGVCGGTAVAEAQACARSRISRAVRK